MPLREFWERKSSTLACRWGCSDYEDIEERPRPQSAASAPTTAVNPIAGEGEPYFPKRSRLHRVLAGSAVVMTMCAAGGCLTELAQELLVIMVGKQIIYNVQEILVPELGGWWQRSRLRSKERKAGLARCPGRQADFELLPFQGLFDGHLEMVLHSGFITVFVAACLLAPLFTLLNDRVEIRLDARKFGRERRRPVAERAQDIGIWFHILAAITRLAVIGNHMAFSVGRVLDLLVPDIPGSVEIKVKQECYLAKQALAENE
ncbi:Anoctamin-7, partial [Eschrichtius robustus]|nr:Anoctamin-7 [Eschrichtius robustus]